MTINKVAILGTHTPRRCGIATFTHDLADALRDNPQASDVIVVAVNDGREYCYPDEVGFVIEQDDLAGFEAVADELNERRIDVLCVQHEFGIFGGPAGSFLLALLRRVQAPIVTTLHTVLEPFTSEQIAVMEELALLSTALVVMSRRAVQPLLAIGVPADKIVVIPHGIPDVTADQATSVGPEERNALLGGALGLLHLIHFDEPFGLSVVEAMACGTPVIAYKRGSMPELITPSSGVLVKDEATALAAIEALRHFDRHAVRRQAETFALERMVSSYLRVYHAIVSAKATDLPGDVRPGAHGGLLSA